MSHLNSIVAAIGDLHLEGNITPHAWYQAPALQFANGKANLVAITLLADLVYWYRPTILRDEATGRVMEIRQKFRADKLQKDYRKWGAQFGLTKGQTEDAVHFLRNAGLLTVETRTIEVMGRMIGNVVFLEPIVEAVKAITSLVVPPPPPDDTPSTDRTVEGTDSITLPSTDRKEKGAGSIGEASTVLSGDSPPIERGNTYITTETSSKTSKKTTTKTTPAPPKAQAKPDVDVVVPSANGIRNTPSTRGCERPTRPSKPTQSGTTRLVDIVASVPPPAPSKASGGLSAHPGRHSEALVGPPPEVRAGLERLGVRIGEDSPAVEALVEMKVKPIQKARQMVAARGEQLVLDWIAAVREGHVDISKRGSAAVLVAALGGDEAWDLPPAYLTARKDKQRRAEQAQEENRRSEQGRLAAEAARREKEEQERRWEALTPARKEEIERQAHADIAAKPMGKRLLEGSLGEGQLRVRCLELMTQNAQKTVQKAA